MHHKIFWGSQNVIYNAILCQEIVCQLLSHHEISWGWSSINGFTEYYLPQVKRSLTRPFGADDKETIHCEFDLRHSEVTWTSGDALGIYPQNDPTEVSALLGVVTSQGSEVTEVPKWAYEPKPGILGFRLQ